MTAPQETSLRIVGLNVRLHCCFATPRSDIGSLVADREALRMPLGDHPNDRGRPRRTQGARPIHLESHAKVSGLANADESTIENVVSLEDNLVIAADWTA